MERSRSYMEKCLEEEKTSKGVEDKLEAQSNSASSLSRIPETVFTKTDAQDAYGLGFGRSLYGWIQNFIELPMALVPH